ncbi:MAG: sigma 54-interacting transcriptional regulator [Owenweeksia sp.]|nr:sigma 54-interacting transcriptional regulator [Owenweeksia sp.]
MSLLALVNAVLKPGQPLSRRRPKQRVRKVATSNQKSTSPPTDDDFIHGNSASTRRVNEYVERVGPDACATVLIQGESGTGKEYVAQQIHRTSKRSDQPFVAIDCGSLSKELAASELFGHIKGSFTGASEDRMGQFEAAGGGTLLIR